MGRPGDACAAACTPTPVRCTSCRRRASCAPPPVPAARRHGLARQRRRASSRSAGRWRRSCERDAARRAAPQRLAHRRRAGRPRRLDRRRVLSLHNVAYQGVHRRRLAAPPRAARPPLRVVGRHQPAVGRRSPSPTPSSPCRRHHAGEILTPAGGFGLDGAAAPPVGRGDRDPQRHRHDACGTRRPTTRWRRRTQRRRRRRRVLAAQAANRRALLRALSAGADDGDAARRDGHPADRPEGRRPARADRAGAAPDPAAPRRARRRARRRSPSALGRAGRRPPRVGSRSSSGYDEALAHLLFGGGDLLADAEPVRAVRAGPDAGDALRRDPGRHRRRRAARHRARRRRPSPTATASSPTRADVGRRRVGAVPRRPPARRPRAGDRRSCSGSWSSTGRGADPAGRVRRRCTRRVRPSTRSAAELGTFGGDGAEPHVLVIVLAGGEGKRLLPLTNDRAKPAVPFGGCYRLIDFALSNFANAGLPQDRRADAVQEPQPRPPHQPDVAVLDAARRLRHAGAGADAPRAVLVPGLGRRDLPEPQPDPRREPRPRLRVRRRPHLPDGSAADGRPPPSRSAPGVTVAAIPVPKHEAREFGVIEVDDDGRILAFHEKVADPPTMPGDDRRAAWRRWATTCSTRKTLIDVVTPRDEHVHRHRRRTSSRRSPSAGVAHVYDFSTNVVPGQDERERGYWRDVGTIDAYYDGQHGPDRPASGVQPLQRPRGRCTRTAAPSRRRRCHGARAASRRTSTAACCARGRSCPAPTSSARSSPPACYVDHDAHVTDSILFPGVRVGPGARLHRCIVDKNVEVPDVVPRRPRPGQDRERFTVSDAGIAVIEKDRKLVAPSECSVIRVFDARTRRARHSGERTLGWRLRCRRARRRPGRRRRCRRRRR